MTEPLEPPQSSDPPEPEGHESVIETSSFLDELVAIFADFIIGQEEIVRHAKHLSRVDSRVKLAAERAVVAYKKVRDDLPSGSETDDTSDRSQRAFAAIQESIESSEDLRPEDRTMVLRRALAEIDLVEDIDDKRSRKQFVAADARRRDAGVMASQLVNMVGELELFISRFVTRWLQEDLSHLGDKQVTLTLAEMREITSVEDVIEQKVTDFIDELMHSGSVSWFGALEKMLETKVEGAEDFTFVEAIQRRHVIVHHGGLASRRYLRALKGFPMDVALESHLPVNLRYLISAGDAMGAVAHSVVVCGLLKSKEGKKEIETAIAELTFFLLQRERNVLVERFGSGFKLDRMKHEFPREQIRVNDWIARSAIHGADSIKAEVEAWDVDAKGDLFKLAQLTLAGRAEEAVSLARQLVANETLSPFAILTWPLFSSISDLFFAEDEQLADEGSDAVS